MRFVFFIPPTIHFRHSERSIRSMRSRGISLMQGDVSTALRSAQHDGFFISDFFRIFALLFFKPIQ